VGVLSDFFLDQIVGDEASESFPCSVSDDEKKTFLILKTLLVPKKPIFYV